MLFRRIVFIILCISIEAFGQSTPNDIPHIRVMATAQNNEVLLRWAVDQPIAWKRANDYGFRIERFTVARKGVVLNQPEKKEITSIPLKMKPLDAWKSIVEKDDYAAILAQALYGESFEVEGTEEGSLLQIVNKANELEQRFSFALFAADMNFGAALLAGWGYIDKTTKPDEKYLYRISAEVPKDLVDIQTGSVVIEPSKVQSLPSPIDLLAVGQDKTIMLSWEYQMFKGIFTSYYVERSKDGVSFSRLGDTPLVNMNDKPGLPSQSMVYIDTIPNNTKPYYYRVKGISPFGITSPPSKIVKAQGVPALEHTPRLLQKGAIRENEVTLQWEFPKEAEYQVKGFELNWATNPKGPYRVIQSQIDKTQREFTYTELQASNYFTITANALNNTKKTSLPVFVQTIDSIPPQVPTELNGTIDSTGVVNFSWKANAEKDLLGYRVFRGNRQGEELVQLTIDPISTSNYVDTVKVASLNSKVYYSVVAVDNRYNMSDYSEILELKKPDKVPPTSPIFSDYKIENGGVNLSWINSSSSDVKKHVLYRKSIAENEETWEAIFETDTVQSYKDTEVKGSQKYRYAIFAEDQSGLTSEPSTPVTLTVVDFLPIEVIQNLNAIPNSLEGKISLSWKIKDGSKVNEVVVYKSKAGGKPKLFIQLPVNKTTIEDTEVYPNTKYMYYVKPIMGNGNFSKPKSIEVNY